VVLSADPLADIHQTRDIVLVFRDGVRYPPLPSQSPESCSGAGPYRRVS
jgi:hypothetical protein